MMGIPAGERMQVMEDVQALISATDPVWLDGCQPLDPFSALIERRA